MRTETITTHVECDTCRRSEENGFPIAKMTVAVLNIGHLDEYGNFHRKYGGNIGVKRLDLCSTCATKALDRVVKSKSQMFTANVYYSFQDIGEGEA
ncbi:hypothetical protein BMT55_16705 [Listeria newyorkensis]|uniref:Uncharacterized protein n=1 Tax=Listeria newyorkensis TaxID=1497681 RepID=A0ABX4XIV5_9LIST|nr:hypothetical protein EP58_03185 [Listeria newyorkensis]PNP86908.1 hypothetical protein BMT55_16705 [Listeria newyorkensis]RQW65823.1 hypothetical protein DUK53_14510 [Listeria sp. SHR_NRA_18]SQC55358.1 Uncharacterised protein [Listeria newyorkensis]